MWVNQFWTKIVNRAQQLAILSSPISASIGCIKKKFSTNWTIPFTREQKNLGADPRAFPYSLAELSSTREIHFAHVRESTTGLEMTRVTRRTRKGTRKVRRSMDSSVQAELCDPRNNLAWQRDVSLLWRCLQRCRTRHLREIIWSNWTRNFQRPGEYSPNRRLLFMIWIFFNSFSSLSFYSSIFDDIFENCNSMESKLDNNELRGQSSSNSFDFIIEKTIRWYIE